MGEYQWFAVYVKSRSEKKVHQTLLLQDVESFLPLQKRLKQWSDRKKWIEEPLIRSYLFVKICDKEYYKVLNTYGVVRYVTFLNKAISIPEWQIDMLKKTVNLKIESEVTREIMHTGAHVEVISGPFQGIQGQLVDFLGKKMFLVEISHIGHSLLLKIPPDLIKLK